MITSVNRLCPKCLPLDGRTSLDLVLDFPSKYASLSILAFKLFTPGPGVNARLQAPVTDLTANTILATIPAKIETVRELAKHDKTQEAEYYEEVPIEILPERLSKLVSDAELTKKALALYSSCWARDGGNFHIPMMDFHVPSSDEGLKFVIAGLHAANAPDGVILNSGNSYHYYGNALLLASGWIEFMTRCLLLAPLTDIRYIAHRLLAGRAALRLTASGAKTTVPTIVACLHRTD